MPNAATKDLKDNNGSPTKNTEDPANNEQNRWELLKIPAQIRGDRKSRLGNRFLLRKQVGLSRLCLADTIFINLISIAIQLDLRECIMRNCVRN